MCRPLHLLIWITGTLSLHATAQTTDSLRVLDSQEVDLGDRKIIYNRLEAPVLKPQVEEASTVETPLSRVEEPPADPRPHFTVFCSVTTHPDGASQVRWHHGGEERVVWSNVNFRDFAPLASFQSASATYSILLAGAEIRPEEAKELKAAGLLEYPPASLPTASAGLHWIAASPLDPEGMRMMEDFHQFYLLHGRTLAAQRREQEEANAARAAWLKANPPVPQDTVVNFFPIRSDYGNAREEAK